MDLMVDRVVTDHRNYILGMLELPDINFFVLERAWLHNASEISCVPTGIYDLWFQEEKDLWYLMKDGVVSVSSASAFPRWGVRIGDIANTFDEIKGCLALGMGCKWAGEFPYLTDSRKAHDAFNHRLEKFKGPHHLEIQGEMGWILND